MLRKMKEFSRKVFTIKLYLYQCRPTMRLDNTEASMLYELENSNLGASFPYLEPRGLK